MPKLRRTDVVYLSSTRNGWMMREEPDIHGTPTEIEPEFARPVNGRLPPICRALSAADDTHCYHPVERRNETRAHRCCHCGKSSRHIVEAIEKWARDPMPASLGYTPVLDENGSQYVERRRELRRKAGGRA